MRTAIITGGTGAVGAALVEEFAADYDVVFTYHKNKEAADTLAEKFRATPVKCDLAQPEDLRRLGEYADECRLLVNNAGISLIKPINDVTDEEWQSMTDIDLSAVFLQAMPCRSLTQFLIASLRDFNTSSPKARPFISFKM